MTQALIDEFLSRLPDRVSRSLKVLSKEELGFPSLLHISANTGIKQFIPRVSTRQLGAEDMVVPRVVCAPTLYGCVLAYQSMPHDYLWSQQKTKERESNWRNGYKIYAIPFDYCLLPNEALVPDVKHSGETWLVNYDASTRVYVPQEAGRMFAVSLNYQVTQGELPACEAILYIEVTDPQGLQLSKRNHLEPGYYEVEMVVLDNHSWRNLSWKDDEAIVVKPITQKEWLEQKRSVASMLSHESATPPYLRW